MGKTQFLSGCQQRGFLSLKTKVPQNIQVEKYPPKQTVVLEIRTHFKFTAVVLNTTKLANHYF